MNAKEAQRLSNQAEERERQREKEESDKLKMDEEAARLRARRDAKKVLKEIHDKIAKAVGESRKVDQWLEYCDKRVGRAYLSALIKTLETKLHKQGYKTEIVNYESYARVFDGSLMNPEVVGYEYTRDSALMYVEW
jgi:type VI protein secretion system component VasF